MSFHATLPHNALCSQFIFSQHKIKNGRIYHSEHPLRQGQETFSCTLKQHDGVY